MILGVDLPIVRKFLSFLLDNGVDKSNLAESYKRLIIT